MGKKSSGTPRITPEVRAGRIYIVHQSADGAVRERLNAHIKRVKREGQLRAERLVDPRLELLVNAVAQAREDAARAWAKVGGAPSTPGRPHPGDIRSRHQ